METFVNIRAAGRFANGMQVQVAKVRFEFLNGLKVRFTLPEPLWQTGLRQRRNLDQRFRRHEKLLVSHGKGLQPIFNYRGARIPACSVGTHADVLPLTEPRGTGPLCPRRDTKLLVTPAYEPPCGHSGPSPDARN